MGGTVIEGGTVLVRAARGRRKRGGGERREEEEERKWKEGGMRVYISFYLQIRDIVQFL